MQKKKSTIEVPAAVAQAYRSASPASRKRAEKAMAVALLPCEEAAAQFQELTQRTSAYARRQGLTREKLDELLREDNGV